MKPPGTISRLRRHARLTKMARGKGDLATPPLLILFINSICNLTCEHCFYWQNLNQRDDLEFDELRKLSEELDPIEILNLSGGEPFLRPEFAEIVQLFVDNNGVRQVYVPTNGFFPERTEKALRQVLASPQLNLFACELSLDGTQEYHNKFRGNARSFQKAMETYDVLAALQKEDSRLRIHSISTATHENMDEIQRLTDYLYERCPAMDHHNIAMIRGDRKNPALQGPQLDAYRALWAHVRARWSDREEGRFGSSVEPMLQWTKVKTAEEQRQVVPCRAGILTGVVHANGDIGLCETHPPIGNLRKNTFREIWASEEAKKLRGRIACAECWCTNEVFMWPSIVYQPGSLARAYLGARGARKSSPAARSSPQSA